MNWQTIPRGRLIAAGMMALMLSGCWLSEVRAADPVPSYGRTSRTAATAADATTSTTTRGTTTTATGTLDTRGRTTTATGSLGTRGRTTTGAGMVGASMVGAGSVAAPVPRSPVAEPATPTIPQTRGGRGFAQTGGGSSRVRTDGLGVTVFRLQYIPADAAFVVIEDIMGPELSEPGSTVLPEPRSNALWATGSQRMMETLQRIVADLDVPPKTPERITRIFKLARLDPEEAAEILVDVLQPQEFSIAMDRATRSLVLSGDGNVLSQVESLLARLDSEPRDAVVLPDGSATYQVRVVWLVDSPEAPEGFSPPAEDLEDVISELRKIGMLSVFQVGQTIVNLACPGDFQASGSPLWQGMPADLRISGRIREPMERPRLEIKLSARQEYGMPGPDRKTMTLADLGTEISAPLNHHIVLGATPMGSATSIFVVQIVPSN